MKPYVAVLDVSSFVWDKDDYEKNDLIYLKMMDRILTLQSRLLEHRAHVLLRNDLYNQILAEFPYTLVPNRFNDFTWPIISFLMNLGDRMHVYASTKNQIISTPDLLKTHFSRNTKDEVEYIINHIHIKQEPESKFFTYQYLWKGDDALKTNGPNESFEYETIIVDKDDALKDFFYRYKRIFEHNPKHDKYKSGGDISPLSSYNERSGDPTRAQSLLDTAVLVDGDYYNYDLENDVWVIFRQTKDNVYHGFDEKDLDNIPPIVKRKISK